MYHSETIIETTNCHGSENIEVLALDAALLAESPNPRSPAFAIQTIFTLAAMRAEKDGEKFARDDFLLNFPTLRGDFYKGYLSWNIEKSCWVLENGPTIDGARIQNDATRWYLNGWDFTRHTRDLEFQYPEDENFGQIDDGIDRLFNALMPLKHELTRRIFFDYQNNRHGYCDVFRSDEEDMYTTEIGFFSDSRTHQIQFGKQPFWELEGFTIPILLSKYRVLCYRLHHISARRSICK